MNPKNHPGINLSDAVSKMAAHMREMTLRIRGSRGHQGSGTLWPRAGLIITNAHVADASVHDVEFSDGQKAEGWLVARDPERDLAALAVSVHPAISASV